MFYSGVMFTTAPSSTARSREGLLDAWVATRRQIARLEAEASALLAERVTLFEGDVRAQPVHRDTRPAAAYSAIIDRRILSRCTG